MVAIKTTSAAAGSAVKTKRPNKAIALRVCSHPECTKSPYFGWHGESAVSCVGHKEPGVLQVARVPFAVCCWKSSKFIYNIFSPEHTHAQSEREGSRACKWRD